jgi:hypothetical protein
VFVVRVALHPVDRLGLEELACVGAGLFTDYRYAAEIATHVVMLDHHVEIEALECTAADATRRTPSPPPGKNDHHQADDGLPLLRRSKLFGTPPGAAAEQHDDEDGGDFTLDVELTLRNASGLQPNLFVIGTLINGAEQWSECVINGTHRRCGLFATRHCHAALPRGTSAGSVPVTG